MASGQELRNRIAHALNCCSAENGSDTPDFILASYLADCLKAFDAATTAREKYYGREPKISGGDISGTKTDGS